MVILVSGASVLDHSGFLNSPDTQNTNFGKIPISEMQECC